MKLKTINSFFFGLIICVSMFYVACDGNRKTYHNSQKQQYNIFDSSLITANKYLVKEDIAHIKNYIKRRNWDMLDGDGGIKYMITHHGLGDSVSRAPELEMDYRIELLDGTVCYSSETDGKKHLVVGSSQMETGLIKAFKKLCHGDKAVFILPPHFAKGLVGDLNKIPPHSVIVYFVDIK